MNREQAVEIIEQALSMAIEALKAQLSQEGATSDLISRQAARHALCKAVHKGEDVPCENQTASCLWTGTRVCDFVREIDALPTIQPEPHWIPVSERMPEDMQFVLLTVRRLKDEYNHEPFISAGYIGWNQTHWWCAHDGDCEISNVEVIAWMPLPEPYEERRKR